MRFKVNIRSALLDRLFEDEIEQPDDGRVGFSFVKKVVGLHFFIIMSLGRGQSFNQFRKRCRFVCYNTH